MTIIQIEANEKGQHFIQSQGNRRSCWIPGYIEVPPQLEGEAWNSLGFCYLEIKDGVLTGITPREIPQIPAPPHQYTDLELVQQEVTDLELATIEQGQAQTDLELMILGGADNV